MNNQRSVDKATVQMTVQRSFDAQQATEKAIKPISTTTSSTVWDRMQRK
jgi:hypothetical protein